MGWRSGGHHGRGWSGFGWDGGAGNLGDLGFLGGQSTLQLGNLLFEVDVFLADPGNFRGVLDTGVRQTKGKVDFCFFHGGQDFLALGGVRTGFEVFLIKVNRADGVAQFIPVEQANLEVGLSHVGVNRDGFLELFDRGRVVEIGHVLGGLAEEGIAFVLSIGAGRCLGAGNQKDRGEDRGKKRESTHRVILVSQRRLRKPRVCLG